MINMNTFYLDGSVYFDNIYIQTIKFGWLLFSYCKVIQIKNIRKEKGTRLSAK